jgi:hypothetical protein
MNMKFSLSQWIFYSAILFVLLLIFSTYFAPDMMVALTNQVWALCGW